MKKAWIFLAIFLITMSFAHAGENVQTLEYHKESKDVKQIEVKENFDKLDPRGYRIEVNRGFFSRKPYLRMVSNANGKVVMHGEPLQNFADAVITAVRISNASLGGQIQIIDNFTKRSGFLVDQVTMTEENK